MSKLIGLIIFECIFLASHAQAEMVYLDCNSKLTSGSLSDVSVGDDREFQFDIDLEKGQARIGTWTTRLYTFNPTEPEYALGIGSGVVTFGKYPGFDASIDRETLDFKWSFSPRGASGEGKCKLIEKRDTSSWKF